MPTGNPQGVTGFKLVDQSLPIGLGVGIPWNSCLAYSSRRESERNPKRDKVSKDKEGRGTQSRVAEVSGDVSEASEDELLVLDDCIEVL
jgi:hypothetical protein